MNKGQRAEFSDGRRLTKIEMEKDYWYGLSIFVPEEFAAPVKSNAVLFQWHTQQGGPSPVLSIRVQGGEWLINGNATEKRRTLARLPLVKGRWTDWAVHARWSAGKKGFWTVWKDGVEVVSERDIVTQYPEALGPYAKFGQYHSVGEAPQNVVYFDEYRVSLVPAAVTNSSRLRARLLRNHESHPLMKRFLAWFTNLYPVWLVGTAVIAFFQPPTMLWFSGQWIVWALSSRCSAWASRSASMTFAAC